MNTALIYISREILEYIFKGSDCGYKTNLPKDTIIRSVIQEDRIFNPLRFCIRAESSEFPKVAEGAEYPIFDVIITKFEYNTNPAEKDCFFVDA